MIAIVNGSYLDDFFSLAIISFRGDFAQRAWYFCFRLAFAAWDLFGLDPDVEIGRARNPEHHRRDVCYSTDVE